MLAAEESGAFQYNDGLSSAPEAEAMTDRLQELSISKKDNDAVTIAKIASAPAPEKTTKLASSSRPLTVDDDDLDIDLEIDDTIDITVSSWILIFVVFEKRYFSRQL